MSIAPCPDCGCTWATMDEDGDHNCGWCGRLRVAAPSPYRRARCPSCQQYLPLSDFDEPLRDRGENPPCRTCQKLAAVTEQRCQSCGRLLPCTDYAPLVGGRRLRKSCRACIAARSERRTKAQEVTG